MTVQPVSKGRVYNGAFSAQGNQAQGNGVRIYLSNGQLKAT